MRSKHQRAVCEFVREILSFRTDELITLACRPDIEYRQIAAVDELWGSPSRRYAVEHTRLESFEGQLADQAKLERLLAPVRPMLAGHLPGTYTLSVMAGAATGAHLNYDLANKRIAHLVLEAAPRLSCKETKTIRSELLPFELQLHRRREQGSQVFIHCVIESDLNADRLRRIRRALDEKCPKLLAWACEGRLSVLVLESDDLALANVFHISDAVRDALSTVRDQPYMIVLVETDASPWDAWVLKEGAHLGDQVPAPNGRRRYTKGQLR